MRTRRNSNTEILEQRNPPVKPRKGPTLDNPEKGQSPTTRVTLK